VVVRVLIGALLVGVGVVGRVVPCEARPLGSGRLELRLEVAPRPPKSGGEVRWIFRVTNSGGRSRRLSFPSSERGDVVLLDGGGERYRWSRERVFAAVVGERLLAPGERWTFVLVDSLRVPPGRYELTARLAARGAPPPVRATVLVRA
jgi:intracellular proteinase inhibitor BsuPI